jgi:hypothetical protein
LKKHCNEVQKCSEMKVRSKAQDKGKKKQPLLQNEDWYLQVAVHNSCCVGQYKIYQRPCTRHYTVCLNEVTTWYQHISSWEM